MTQAQDDIVKLMQQAILQRYRVAIQYRGQTNPRIVEPHALYRDRHNQFKVDCYQISGHSESGRKPPFWRPFRLEKITGFSQLDQRFQVKKDFDYDQPHYKQNLIAIVGKRNRYRQYSVEELRRLGPITPQKTRNRYLA